MNSKNFKNRKNKLKRITVIFFSSLLILVIIVAIPKECSAYPSLSLNRLKSIVRNVIQIDYKFKKKEAINIKELLKEQENKNIFQKKIRSFRLFIKNIQRKYFKKVPYQFNSELNKNKILLDPRQIPLSQRTTKLSTLIQKNQQQFQNNFKQFYKFYLPLKYQNTEIGISNLFNKNYPIELIDSFTLMRNIHPVRFLIDDPIYLQPLKRIDFGIFNYSNVKSPELINLVHLWI